MVSYKGPWHTPCIKSPSTLKMPLTKKTVWSTDRQSSASKTTSGSPFPNRSLRPTVTLELNTSQQPHRYKGGIISVIRETACTGVIHPMMMMMMMMMMAFIIVLFAALKQTHCVFVLLHFLNQKRTRNYLMNNFWKMSAIKTVENRILCTLSTQRNSKAQVHYKICRILIFSLPSRCFVTLKSDQGYWFFYTMLSWVQLTTMEIWKNLLSVSKKMPMWKFLLWCAYPPKQPKTLLIIT